MSSLISQAMHNADRLVSVARTKATTAGDTFAMPGALANAGDAEQRNNISAAADQYRHNRGWVYACVRLVAQRIAAQQICVARKTTKPAAPQGLAMKAAFRESLPLHLKQQADHLEPLETHPILELLADPWELGTAWSMIFTTIASLELTGRSLWYVSDDAGRPQVMPIPTSWIDKLDRRNGVWDIRFPNSHDTVSLPIERVVNFFYPSPNDPFAALSPLQAAAGAVLTNEAIEDSHHRFFSQGCWPQFALIAGELPAVSGQAPMRPTFTAEQRTQLVEAIRHNYRGVHRLGEPVILDGLIKDIKPLSLVAEELGFLDSEKLTKSKILQIFCTSPILLGEVEGANRASATVADEIFVGNKILPLSEMCSQAMTEWLGPMFASPGEELVIWITPAVAHDPEDRFRKFELAVTAGVVTPNEIRRHAELPAIDGGDEVQAASPEAESEATPQQPPQQSVESQPTEDVQATALNGAQIASLQEIVAGVSEGRFSRDAARQMLYMSFPNTPRETIDSLVATLEEGPPAATPAAVEVAKELNPYNASMKTKAASNGEAKCGCNS